MNGITYYRLESEFPGDKTKNCGLEGIEIDNNFYFLEKKIVKSVTTSEDNNDFILTFLDGTQILSKDLLNISEKVTLNFDRKKGELILDVNGKKTVIGGFVNEKVYVNPTLSGDGTKTNPLGLADSSRTGLYRLVKDILDFEELPTDNKNGDRYLIKRKISPYGKLYNFNGVLDIVLALSNENSQWRVPSKKDWDDMLNALEPCEEYQDHNKPNTCVFLGDVAGKILKKDGEWIDGNTEDMFGFSAYPAGYAYDGNRCVSFFGENTRFWTTSTKEGTDAYIKEVRNGKSTVFQDIIDGVHYCSIRLVRDIENDSNVKVEKILGSDYNTVVMPSNEKGSRKWTSENLVYALEDANKALSPEIYDNENNERYFIYEWNGEGWDISELSNNEGVFVLDRKGFIFKYNNEIISSADYKIDLIECGTSI